MDVAMAIAEAMNTLGAVASSPIFARMLREHSPREVRRALLDVSQELLQVVAVLRSGSSGGEQIINAEPAIQEMQRRVTQWDPGAPLAHDLIEQARVCLNALGVNTPPAGWDSLAESGGSS